MEEDKKLGIIGCGNMGEAIARGVINCDVIYGLNLYLYDIDRDKSAFLKNALNANLSNSVEELVNNCNIILLAVKPQDIEDLLNEIKHMLDSSKLVLSIAAGVTIKRIKGLLMDEVRVVRIMPNMAAFVNKSISVLCYDDYATSEDKAFAKGIFMSIGDIVETEEPHMDAITAISGSGPAYFFYLTEILEKTAIQMGIGRNSAKQLAVKTALGSAELLKRGGSDAEELRKRVTSKGGTTEAAFRFFTEKKLGDVLQEGIKEAAKRAKELSEGR